MRRSDGRRRTAKRPIRPTLVKVDFLIPRLQDTTRRPHPHTAYEEWDTLLMEHDIHPPTLGPPERGRESWGKETEDSLHWWTAVRQEQVQALLRLLKRDARRIFDQRWMLAWIGKEVYRLGDVPPRRKRK